ncbi:ArdC family protein [Sphingomonas sp. Tas61C01]|uniref:ArdC family protein n=1 Tax=Sphingomonas sp. Tas61C01 TaxID=3458297 RepID=UPI00403EA2BA
MRPTRSSAVSVSPAETITNAIIERLEAGVRPWRQPWTGGPVSRPLRVCGTPYRGVNVIWLWMAAQARGFISPTWMTYHQSQLLGGQVRKGERGTCAIFYKSYSKEVEDPATGEREDEARRVLKSFTVFNVDQIDGLPERFTPEPIPRPEPTARDHALDAFFGVIPASIRHGGGEAYYLPSADQITMPDPAAFRSRDLYRSTLAHELAHWTGHQSRLARSLGNRFGSDAYAMEELIAELASAMVGAELGLPVDHLEDHASYLASWLKVLKADNRAILTAAAKAEEASAFLLGFARVAHAPDALLAA